MKYNNSRRTAAFTLVELLVVVAIIGVLAALLMPAISRANDKAKSIVCISQLRQLGLAVRTYADDHQNRLPSAELLPSQPIDTNAPLPRISQVLSPYLGKASGATESLSVFKCPSDTPGRFASEGSSYEWNTDLNRRRMDEARTGILKIVTMSTEDGQTPQHREIVKQLAFPPEVTPLFLDYEEYHQRAPKSGKNIVYMDGHAVPFELPQ